MTRRPWYKPWYIWLGPLAFLTLFHSSLHVIDKYETKLKIGYPSQRALARKVWRDIFFFGVVVMVVPTVAIMLVVDLLFGTTEHFILEYLPGAYVYCVSVYATYRHVLWREENISHLMKSKGSGK